MKCGYVAVLGRANAGKSSLVNFFVGEEVAIVSHRRQTTRNLILGIKNGVLNVEKTSGGKCENQKYQIVFVDTPGIHHSKNNLDRFMMKNVRAGSAMADVVLYLFDGTKQMDDEEIEYIKKLQKEQQNLILVCTKADKQQKGKSAKLNVCQKQDGGFNEINEFDKVCKDALAISVVTGQNMQVLLQQIVEKLPNGDAVFDEDEYTDKSVKFMIAEKVRGLLLDLLDDEIPHGVAVLITRFTEGKDRVDIDAEIVCERQQHKGIIIGKGGKNLKTVGQKTRLYAEELLGQQVNLKLFVKVDEAWRQHNVADFGYKEN